MDKLLNKYAELVVRTGVNLQPQQLLVINSPIECSDFARRVAEAAFEAGAKDVKVIWSDERLARIRLDKAEAEVFDEFPAWRRDMFMDFKAKGAAVISIHASDPTIFQNVDTDKLTRSQRAAGVALEAERLLKTGGSFPGEALVPNYLRLSQAERERNEKLMQNK